MELFYSILGETAKSPEKLIFMPSCFAIAIFKDNVSISKLQSVLKFASVNDQNILDSILSNDLHYMRAEQQELLPLEIVIDGNKKC